MNFREIFEKFLTSGVNLIFSLSQINFNLSDIPSKVNGLNLNLAHRDVNGSIILHEKLHEILKKILKRKYIEQKE